MADITAQMLDELRSIREEMQKMNINLERHNGKLERHQEDISVMKEEQKKIATLHLECPARIKVQSHGTVLKDIVNFGGFIAAVFALLKAFNIIK